MNIPIILLPLLAAVLLAAPFLEPWLFPLAWVAFVPLFFAIDRAESLRRAVFYGWLMGLAAHLIGFHWLTYTISVFGGFPFAVSVVIFVLYAALQGIQMALFALLVRSIGFGPLMIFPALFWVPCEFLFPLLFPWYLANSQVSFLWLIQTADLVGPYGTGFIVMWFSAALYHAPVRQRRAAKEVPAVGLRLFSDSRRPGVWIPARAERRRRDGQRTQVIHRRGAGQRRHRHEMESGAGAKKSCPAPPAHRQVRRRAAGHLAGVGNRGDDSRESASAAPRCHAGFQGGARILYFRRKKFSRQARPDRFQSLQHGVFYRRPRTDSRPL